jgi:hypothetical protein
MEPAERVALLHVLRIAEPESAIEVGTDCGGSLEQICRHARSAYSIDLSPDVRARLEPEMPEVEFLTGDSREMIGVALRKCSDRGLPLGFVLLDGDHRPEGVRGDIEAVLAHRPTRPVWVLIHDSSNPGCRAGIAGSDWGGHPHVHAVDLDFVTGALCDDPEFLNQIWGGFALALLLPEPRRGALRIHASSARHHAALLRASDHGPGLAKRIRRWWRIKRKGLDRRIQALRARRAASFRPVP